MVNCVNRNAFLSEIRYHFPTLARWTCWCYGGRSDLFFGDYILHSTTGVQQGDPIGPMLFSLAIHALVKELALDHGLSLSVFYLDDGILCGSAENVGRALRRIQELGPRMGLSLKMSKCSLICPSGSLSDAASRNFPTELLFEEETGESRVTLNGNFQFLGAAFGDGEFCEGVLQKRVDKATELIKRIAKFENTQIGFRLLRNCAGFCKVLYSMRTGSPDSHENALAKFDAATRQGFESLTGLGPQGDEWEQATLGFKNSGLGLRSAVAHSSAAYVSSLVCTRKACMEIDASHVWEANDPASSLNQALASINANLLTGNQIQLPEDPTQKLKQKKLSQAIDQAKFREIFARRGAAGKATMLSESLPGASGFLSVIPSKALRTNLEPAEFVIELQVRLSMEVYPVESFCPLCDSILNSYGFHAGHCVCGGDWTACHNAARNILAAFAKNAGLSSETERPHLLPPRYEDPSDSGLRRPADVYIPSWRNGSPAAIDLAIVSPQRLDLLAHSSQVVGWAASEYDIKKRLHLGTEQQCIDQGIDFLPVVAERSGGWGKAALQTFSKLTKIAARCSVESSGEIFSSLLEKLSVAIRRAKARAILKRSSVGSAAVPAWADTAHLLQAWQ